MLSKSKAEQILDTAEFEDCAKMLADNGYPDMSGMSIGQIEKTLTDCRRDLFKELESMIPNTGILDLFRLKFDYHNAKVLVKNASRLELPQEMLSPEGRYSIEQIQELFALFHPPWTCVGLEKQFFV